jgi:GNAT superfamily N-acetyltransferase
MIAIRPVEPRDAGSWLRLRRALWPETPASEWFVVPDARKRGIGRALIDAAERWAHAQGCCEFASDTQPDNELSAAAHRALGFSEVGLVRCFRKEL